MTSRLRELILDQIEFQNLEIETALKKAKFPEHYFDAILSQQHEKLPAFPYMRMHLIDLAKELDLDSQKILDLYKQEFSEKISGEYDKLPGNRFAITSGKKPLIGILALLGFGVIVYVFLTSSFFGTPKLEIAFPPENPTPFTVTTDSITLSGMVSSRDTLTINDKKVVLSDDGSFLVEYSLEPEFNSIAIEATRFLGSKVRVVRQVFYDTSPPVLDPVTSTSTEDQNFDEE